MTNKKNWIAIDCYNNIQTDRASGYIYMHMPIMALAALDSPVFQIYVNFGKNWILIDCQNNKQRNHCGKGTILRGAESMQNSIHHHKILQIVE